MKEFLLTHFKEHHPLRVALFFLLLLFCLTPFVSPPIALGLGILLGITIGSPYVKGQGDWTKVLLQASVVGLGFGMSGESVLEVGDEGLLLATLTVIGTLAIGILLSRWMRVDAVTGDLIACGTAICGGSAIAAVGPVLDADSREMSVALGVVFILNGVGLFLFPAIGHAFNLSQTQFGIWAAIAIHDTSSVVGAGAEYGEEALAIATTVKLTRALWIIPLVLVAKKVRHKSEGPLSIPWFILLFVVAVLCRTFLGELGGVLPALADVAKKGMTITLFLIGSSLSRTMLKGVGVRPLLQGIFLWLIISSAALWGVIAIE